jgi:hypothetical protein
VVEILCLVVFTVVVKVGKQEKGKKFADVPDVLEKF